jgi:hypothetical protein
MGRNAGSRRVSDTGSTTGVATTILALLSAGTVATITLVGVNQLAPPVSHLGSAHELSSLPAPRAVDVTPHSSASPSSIGGSHAHASKPGAGSPRDVTVVQAPPNPRGVTRVITGISRIRPEGTPPSVDPTPPPATPTVSPSESPTMRAPTSHAHPSGAHRARHGHTRRSAEPTREDRSARSRRGSSGCRQHEGGNSGRRSHSHGGNDENGDHRGRNHGGNSGDGGRGASGRDGSGDDHAQRGHDHGGHDGSQHHPHGH